MKTTWAWMASGGILAASLGCGDAAPRAERKPASALDYATEAPTTSAPVEPRTPPPPATEQVKAEIGVGKKGHGYGGGLITEPVHQYFAQQERITYEIEVPQAMNLYKASHDFKGPATHEAFMKEIIKDNNIKLPELPEGHRYIYDPKTETLMVERPTGGNHDGK